MCLPWRIYPLLVQRAYSASCYRLLSQCSLALFLERSRLDRHRRAQHEGGRDHRHPKHDKEARPAEEGHELWSEQALGDSAHRCESVDDAGDGGDERSVVSVAGYLSPSQFS